MTAAELDRIWAIGWEATAACMDVDRMAYEAELARLDRLWHVRLLRFLRGKR